MFKYKHLGDLLKLSSVLPALLVTPTFADDISSSVRLFADGEEKIIGGDTTDNINVSTMFLNAVESLNGGKLSLKANDTIIASNPWVGGAEAENNSSLDMTASDITISGFNHGLASQSSQVSIDARNNLLISATDVNGYAVDVKDGGTVSLNANKLDITGTGTAIYAMTQGNVDVAASEVNISGAFGIGTQNNTTESEDALATVDIKADKLDIQTDRIAITAFSQGVVNINAKDTTIYSDDELLSTRGGAETNINVGTDNVSKLTGNIDFNYNDATSETEIDAKVNIDLVGEESFWTGNTIVAYDKKPTDDKLVVSNANLKLKDGATWNATKITDNADVEEYGYYYTALNNLTIENGTVNIADADRGIYVDNVNVSNAVINGGPLTINNSLNLNGSISGDGALNLADGATMNIGTSTIELSSITLNGNVVASIVNPDSFGKFISDSLTVGESATLNLNVGATGEYNIFAGQDFDLSKITYNDTLFSIATDGGKIIVSTKAVEDIAADTGVSTAAAGAVAALTNAEDDLLNTISLQAQQDLVAGNVEKVETETAKLNPDDKPVAQSVATSVQNQVLSLAAGRMSGTSVGRSGGDLSNADYGVWVQGLYNRSKYNGKFDGKTSGVSVGADTLVDGKYTFGIGYAYNDTDIDSNSRDTKVKSNSVFLYGQYKPTQWYVNAALNYTMADYTETSDPYGVVYESKYDVASFGGQVATGYDLMSGLTPEVGVRYLHVSQDAYESLLGRVNGVDTDYLTGVAGIRYAFEIESDSELKFSPELRAAATYDVLSDSAVATITAPGNLSYVIDAERLSRFGGEFGIGLMAEYRGLQVSLNYDLDLHEDYTSQTGMLKFRYDF